MTRSKAPGVPDDAWFLQTLRLSLGEALPDFLAEEGAADPLADLASYESILYSLGKQDLVLLFGILRAFSHSSTPRPALHALVKRLRDVLGVSHCSLILVGPNRDDATVVISHEDPEFAGVRVSLKHYPEIQRSLRTGKITIVKNPSLDPLMLSLKKEQIRRIKDVSIMVLPLIVGCRAFGSLLVRKQRSKEGFVLREVRICQLMVHLVTLALRSLCRSEPLEVPGLEANVSSGRLWLERKEGWRSPETDFLACLPIGVFLVDGEDRIRMANQRASEITGYTIEHLRRMSFSDIVPVERLGEIREMRRNSGGEPAGLDRYHFSYQPPGEDRPRILSFERHPFPGDASLGWVFFRDVTKEKDMEDGLQTQASQLREANESLQRINERLDELNRMKTQFLAVATHEIRTPLSVVIGYNQFLLQEKAGRIQAAQRKILDESIQACERLLNIVNEMLDFSRIETGNLRLHLREQDVLVLLKRVHRQMKIIADRAKVLLRLQIPAKTVCCVYDPDRLEQVLVNLISNAIKFTPAGGRITISARKKREPGQGYLELAVSDTGPGLAKELLKRILASSQPLVSQDPAGSRKQGGVGLGLAISRRILDAHGSRLCGHSEEGKGATFSFRLPLLERPGAERDKG